MKPIIEANNIVRRYSPRPEDEVLKGLSLRVFPGEILAIVGPSGVGKTTLLNILGLLDSPTEGTLHYQGRDPRYRGRDLFRISNAEKAKIRNRHFGFVFQLYHLLPDLSVLENVMLPMLFLGMRPSDAEVKAAELLAEVGLGDRLHHRPDQLSGGQQQRVAVARALANDPSIILADEPTANLDLHTGSEIIEKLASLSRERGVTIISATHDHKMLSVSDRIVWIRSGAIERVETRADLKIEVGTIE